MAVSQRVSSLSRAGAVSGKASAILASTVAIALVLPIGRDEWVIALPLCATLARQLLTNSWREAEAGAQKPIRPGVVGQFE
jgi:hypothetical protein